MIRFLALGDSYTVAEGLAPEDSWPQQLVQRLRRRDVLCDVPQVVAQTGWTTFELQAAMSETLLKPPYDWVSLAVGVNNQYRGLAVSDYAAEFSVLLAEAILLAGQRPERVCVLSIPDWGMTPFAREKGREIESVSAEIQAFNRENARLAYAHAVHYVNVTAYSRDARWSPALLAPDGLHYSRLMYSRWVDEIFPKFWHTLFPGKAIHIPLIYQDEASDEPSVSLPDT